MQRRLQRISSRQRTSRPIQERPWSEAFVIAPPTSRPLSRSLPKDFRSVPRSSPTSFPNRRRPPLLRASQGDAKNGDGDSSRGDGDDDVSDARRSVSGSRDETTSRDNRPSTENRQANQTNQQPQPSFSSSENVNNSRRAVQRSNNNSANRSSSSTPQVPANPENVQNRAQTSSNNLLERLARFALPEDRVEDPSYRDSQGRSTFSGSTFDVSGRRISPTANFAGDETAIVYLFKFFISDTTGRFESFLSSPCRLLIAGAIAILFGFYSATAVATITGAVADWDPIAAAILLFWTETLTRYYYRQKRKSITLRLVNAFKVGLIYGMCVDAFKLAG